MNIFVEKVPFERFYKYCKKAGVPEEYIKEFYEICDGIIYNARYYIKRRIFKKKKKFKPIIFSFVFATIKYIFYIFGFYKIGNIFGAISYFFMIYHFIKSHHY